MMRSAKAEAAHPLKFTVSRDRLQLRQLEEALYKETQQPRSGVEIVDLGGWP